MPRFFVDKADINENNVILKEENNFHISRTLRMRKGEEIVVCDLCETDYVCVLDEFHKDYCVAKIISKMQCETESKQKITLFQCLPKADKMEQIVKKSTEMGVFEIYHVISKRCVSRPDEKSAFKKIQRYQKIALEAAKQSQRGIVPRVNDVISFEKMTKLLENFDKAIIYYEKGGERTSEILKKQDGNIAIIIGAEGGFEQAEVDMCSDFGAETATLGKRILRCETASIVAMSVICSFFDEY